MAQGERARKGGDMSAYRGEESIATIKSAAGIILAVSENRNWIEVFFEGDLMHTKTVDLPAGAIFDIYVEEIPHKTTVYEHPRTMIFFDGPCDLEIGRDGSRVIVKGSAEKPAEKLA
jgi:hypothetical protein